MNPTIGIWITIENIILHLMFNRKNINIWDKDFQM
jgi:hypothetical protein